MANSKTYASGTMKATNINGELVPFIPKTGMECVFDYSTGKSAITTIIDIEDSIKEAAAGNGAVQVFNIEPQDSIYESSPKERLFVVMENDLNVWKFTVRSVYGSSSLGYPSTGYFSAIPFCLYNRTDAQLKVDWGDGTTSTLTKANYSSTSSISSSLHKYTQDNESTIHTITITSPDFSKTALMSISTYLGGTESSRVPFKAFRNSLISVDSPIPKVAGIFPYPYNSTTATLSSNSLQGLFYDCSNLKSLCSGVFDCNPNVANFSCILALYTHLGQETMPIPSQLFRYNTNASNFESAFQGRSIKTIPEDLFKYTDKQLNLKNALDNLNEWNPMDSIPTNLFWYNKNIRSLDSLQLQCRQFEIRIGSPYVASADSFMKIGTGSNAPTLNPNERIVYVVNGSTTYNTFNRIADEQKLTVIGV